EIWYRTLQFNDKEIAHTLYCSASAYEGFIECFKDKKTFQSMPMRSKGNAITALENASQELAFGGDPAGANGVTLFAVWMIAVIREEEDSYIHIETALSDYRRKNKV
ncbi:MAG: hypothetical protein K0U41_00435, partial [Gammaproteobacteria bacterium]|nr:hypothetical protein [Gammaproteobacteria bacterium]